MRDHWGLWLLLLISTCGCTTARSNVVARHAAPVVTRAESEHLSELGEAARERHAPVATPPRKRQGHCSTCNSSPCTCSDDSNFVGTVFGPFIIAGLTAPFTIPHAVLGDDFDITARFPDYPYVDDLPGSLIRSTPYDGTTHGWTGTLQLFNVQETHNIDRYGGRLVLESASRFGLDTESNYWAEPSAASISQLWTGDANVVFRFAESETMQFRAGVGVNWLADSHGTEAASI